MDDIYPPYGATDAHADATRLRKITADEAADLVYEIRHRLMATEGCRRRDIDTDYPDMSDALVIADGLIKTGAVARADLKRLADELDATAGVLDEQHRYARNLPKVRKCTSKKSTPFRSPTRDADQIWNHDPGAGR